MGGCFFWGGGSAGGFFFGGARLSHVGWGPKMGGSLHRLVLPHSYL